MTSREISIGGNANRNLIIAGNGLSKEMKHAETEENIYFSRRIF